MREYHINVLGKVYHVCVVPKSSDPRLEECDGLCDKTSKLILVDDCTGKDCNLDNPEVYINKVIRHELVHAFLFESGLTECWEHKRTGHEETTIDWIASMFPKLVLAFHQADALGFDFMTMGSVPLQEHRP